MDVFGWNTLMHNRWIRKKKRHYVQFSCLGVLFVLHVVTHSLKKLSVIQMRVFCILLSAQCVTVHAGSEAMFADLGHFSYAAIQVMLALCFFFFFGNCPFKIWFLVMFCLHLGSSYLPTSSWSLIAHLVTDCFHLSGLSSTHIGIYGTSCILVTASPSQPYNQLLCFSTRYTSAILELKATRFI